MDNERTEKSLDLDDDSLSLEKNFKEPSNQGRTSIRMLNRSKINEALSMQKKLALISTYLNLSAGITNYSVRVEYKT